MDSALRMEPDNVQVLDQAVLLFSKVGLHAKLVRASNCRAAAREHCLVYQPSDYNANRAPFFPCTILVSFYETNCSAWIS